MVKGSGYLEDDIAVMRKPGSWALRANAFVASLTLKIGVNRQLLTSLFLSLTYQLPTFLSNSLTMLIPILKATLRPVVASSFSYAAQPQTTEEQTGSPEFWWKLAISMCLVMAGGVFAGYVLRL
jgi:hypothetical protein